MFTSNIGRAPIIHDGNYHQLCRIGDRVGRGYQGRDYSVCPPGAMPFGRAMDFDLIPRSEWAERIEEMERTKSRLSDHFRRAGLRVLNQQRTNYCWCYGIVQGIQLVRAKQGQPTVHLSAASAAARIKRYRNVGGWGGEAIAGINELGVATLDYWPEASIDRRHDTPEMRANALLHQAPEFYELPAKNFDAVMTCLLRGLPVGLGLLWWGHLVVACDPVIIRPGQFGALFLNSWGEGWGDGGFGVLTERKATPHEAVAPRTVTPSVE